MNKIVYDAMSDAYMAYHAADNAAAILVKNGYKELFEHEDMKFERGGKYFTARYSAARLFLR